MFSQLLNKNISLYLSLLVCLYQYSNQKVNAQGVTLSVSVSETEGVTQEDGKGVYNPTLNHLFKLGLLTKIVYNPGRRARREFVEGRLDCFFPSSKRILTEIPLTAEDVIVSEPIAIGRGMVIFHDYKNPPKINKSLKMGLVGIVELYGYKDVSTIDVKSYSKLIELVEQGRLEAGYFMYPDVHGVEGLSERLKPRLSSAVKLWEEADALLCRKKDKSIVDKISQEIRRLKQSGQLIDGALE